eukprot:2948484-Pyramimonas_sp.AAC.1
MLNVVAIKSTLSRRLSRGLSPGRISCGPDRPDKTFSRISAYHRAGSAADRIVPTKPSLAFQPITGPDQLRTASSPQAPSLIWSFPSPGGRRFFLDETCTDCLHISGVARRLTQHRGSYSVWARRRADQQKTHAHQVELREAKVYIHPRSVMYIWDNHPPYKYNKSVYKTQSHVYIRLVYI